MLDRTATLKTESPHFRGLPSDVFLKPEIVVADA